MGQPRGCSVHSADGAEHLCTSVAARCQGHAPRRVGDQLDCLALLHWREWLHLRRRARGSELLLRSSLSRAIVLCADIILLLPIWRWRMAIAITRGDLRYSAGGIGVDAAALFWPTRHTDRRRAAGLFALAAVFRALLAPRCANCSVGLLDGARLLPLPRHRPTALSVPTGRRFG